MATCSTRNYQNFQFRRHIYQYIIHTKQAYTQSIRVRTHTITNYIDSQSPPDSVRQRIPGQIIEDLVNIKSDTEDSIYPIPKEIDNETIHSWISAITKSTRDGDLRAVQLIYSTMISLNLSIIYPPLYHALIFGFGKLGDIDKMLQTYSILLDHHKQSIAKVSNIDNFISIITANIITTILNNLAIYRSLII